jgi:transposase
MWIADLMACGLIKASFVPKEPFQELRSLMRTRKQLGREQTRHVQRIQKTLEEANIKLDSLITDILGVSGRQMIEAMIAGMRDPYALAALAHRSLKASPPQLVEVLRGRLSDHHRFLLKLHLGQWDTLDAAIRAIDHEVDSRSSGSTRISRMGRVMILAAPADPWCLRVRRNLSPGSADLNPCSLA